MPRYIDADKFVKLFERALEQQQKYGLYNHAKITEYVIKAIENAPTEDVVPRSEYDELKKQFDYLDVECDRLEKMESEYYDEVIQAKQDVVREVIDEFQKMLKCETHYETSITGHRYPVVDIDEIDFIAEELKKKYIGD